MPKEKINHAPAMIVGEAPDADAVSVGNVPWIYKPGAEQPGAWIPDSEGTPVGRDAELAVGWHKDSWVQLSIEADPAYFRMAAVYVDGEEGRTSVYTPPLDRDEINKLIRTLRRAREQVFGRDE